MKGTKIEWCHHTVNFWWGCTFALLLDGSLSEECRNCYAHLLSKLFSRGKATWGPKGNRWIRHEAARRELYKLDNDAHRRGVRERVFINSMSDTFEDREDLNEARGFLWDACKFVTSLDILLLTKRPENVQRMVPPDWIENWPAHVWIGTTCGTQQAADERIPLLLSIPAKVRFLSCEPLLGPVDLTRWLDPTGIHCMDICPDEEFVDRKTIETVKQGDEIRPRCPHCGLVAEWTGYQETGIHWVICGGESGPKARPMYAEWADDLRRQCQAAGVPFFMKQLGANIRVTNANALDWEFETVFEDDKLGEGTAAGARVRLKDRKGGDINEFPSDLIVRQFPGEDV